jgi:hypothetical protein
MQVFHGIIEANEFHSILNTPINMSTYLNDNKAIFRDIYIKNLSPLSNQISTNILNLIDSSHETSMKLLLLNKLKLELSCELQKLQKPFFSEFLVVDLYNRVNNYTIKDSTLDLVTQNYFSNFNTRYQTLSKIINLETPELIDNIKASHIKLQPNLLDLLN